MVIALTGFSFDGNTENGGVGVKLGVYRVQGAQLVKKTARKTRVTERVKSSTMVKSYARKAMLTWWIAL